MKANKLILFMVPPDVIVNGGVMSIFSISDTIRKTLKDSDTHVHIITYPPHVGYGKNPLFFNKEYVYGIDEIISKYKNVDSLLINIPELVAKKAFEMLAPYKQYLNSISDLKINILNQNIRYMPDFNKFCKLYYFTNYITQTTAHDKYGTQETANKYGLPLKHLSVNLDPSMYKKVSYTEKENLIVYSPDNSSKKSEVIEILRDNLKNYKIVETRDLTFEDYKSLIARAKFVITFGEGMDGYLIEGVFSGAIPFSVYNHDFFPSESFLEFQSIYNTELDMVNKIISDIKYLDSSQTFEQLHQKFLATVKDYYSQKRYKTNIKAFLDGKFDYTPSLDSILNNSIQSIKTLVDESAQVQVEFEKYRISLVEKKEALVEKNKAIDKLRIETEKTNKQLQVMYDSFSWKLTKPLRKMSSYIESVLIKLR